MLNNDTLKEGLYFSYIDFINHNPDTNYSIYLDYRSDLEQAYGPMKAQKLYAYNKEGDKIKLKEPLWGFCDGEEFYVFHNKKYCLINTYGKYCILSFESEKRGGGYTRSTTFKSKEYIMDIDTGEKYKLDAENLTNYILKDFPELLMKFQKDRKDESMHYWYVNEVNSKYNSGRSNIKD